MCVCVCVCARVCACACVHVCVQSYQMFTMGIYTVHTIRMYVHVSVCVQMISNVDDIRTWVRRVCQCAFQLHIKTTENSW